MEPVGGDETDSAVSEARGSNNVSVGGIETGSAVLDDNSEYGNDGVPECSDKEEEIDAASEGSLLLPEDTEMEDEGEICKETRPKNSHPPQAIKTDDLVLKDGLHWCNQK